MYDPLLAAAISQSERERGLARRDLRVRAADRPAQAAGIVGRLLRRSRTTTATVTQDAWRVPVDARA